MNLTPRQQEVADLLIQGRSYQFIADELNISKSTVRMHAENIYQSTGVSGAVGNKNARIRLMHAMKE